MKTGPKAASRQYAVAGIAAILFVIGVPNIADGLELLRLLPHVPSDVFWGHALATAGLGLAPVGAGIALLLLLLLKPKTAKSPALQKSRNWLLSAAAASLVLYPWIRGLSFWAGSGVMVDGITVSAAVVMAATLTFSLASWGLLSWASRSVTLPGALLAAISGASLANPFLQVLGPMAAVVLGVVAGFVAFMLQQKMNAPGRRRPLVAALATLGAAYLVLGAAVLASGAAHPWDGGSGIGAWTGTAEGLAESGLGSAFGSWDGLGSFLVVVPALVVAVLAVRRESES